MAEPYEHKNKQILDENEVSANKFVTRCVKILLVMLLCLGALRMLNVVQFSEQSWSLVALISCPLLFRLILHSRLCHYRSRRLKSVLLLTIICICALLDYAFTYEAAPLILLPVVISSHYFSKRITLWTAACTAVLFAASCVFGALYGPQDMNFLVPAGESLSLVGKSLKTRTVVGDIDMTATVLRTLRAGYGVRLAYLVLFTPVIIFITGRASTLISRQKELTEETTRVSTELELASRIQNSMIPQITADFPGCPAIDVYGTMTPAKTVGGDFYDVFYIDSDHLALVIADVSGKGIPASLFMMAAKTQLKSTALPGCTPAEILFRVNNRISAENTGAMFVTVWLGILTLSTGDMVCANAGHEYPVLRRAGSEFTLLKDKHGLVIGEFENMKYTDYTLHFEPGDSLLVYTDGVAEANDPAEQLYGTDRLLACMNTHVVDARAEDAVRIIHEDVDRFAGTAPQFDDLTMLYLRYLG